MAATPLVINKDGRAFVKNSDGQIFLTSEENARDLIATGDRLAATPEEVQRRQAERLSSAPGAAARGVVSGAMGGALAIPKVITSLGSAALGTEDPLARFSGRQFVEDAAAVGAHLLGGESEVAARETGEILRADQQAHPLATMGGEALGQIATMAPLGRAAALAGRAVAGGIGLAGRAATIAAAGAAGTLEGAVVGGEMAHEDAWVKNEAATAQQTLAGMGLGAIFGGTVGAGMSALATRSAARAATPSLAEALGYRAAEDVAPESVLSGATREGAPELETAAERWRKTSGRPPLEGEFAEAAPAAEPGFGARAARDAAGEVSDEAASFGRNWRSRLSSKLDEESVEAIARGNQPAVRALSRDAAERTRLGRIANELDITGARKAGGVIGRSPEEMLQVAGKIRASRGTELGDGLDQISQHIGGIKASEVTDAVGGLVKELEANANTASEMAIADRIRNETSTWLSKLELGGFKTTVAQDGRRMVVPARDPGLRDVSLREIHSLRVSIDKLVKYEKRVPTQAEEALKQLRGRLEDIVEKKIDSVGKESGVEDLVRNYKRTKDEYRVARWAEETLEERIARDAANRKFSLTDYVGAAAGAAAGGPLLGVVTGGATAFANKMFRERGSNTIIALGRRLLGESVVEPGMAPAVYRRTANAVGDIVDGVQGHADEQIGRFLGSGRKQLPPGPDGGGATGSPTPRTPKINTPKAYAEHAQEVLSVAGNPELASARVAKVLGPSLAMAAPNLYTAMTTVAVRAASYLAANLPAPPSDPNSITPQIDNPPPVSPTDLRAYAARVEGVESPLSMLDDLRRGYVAPEKVDAIKNVHPETFQMIRQMVFTRLAARTKEDGPVPYATRRLLDIALDAGGSIEPSMRPGALAAMAAAGESAQQQEHASRQQVPKMSKMFATRSQEIAMR